MDDRVPEVARFQVHECRAAGPGGVTVTGRELAGMLRRGQRVRVEGDSPDGGELTVTRIVAYGHELEEVDPGLTALVELAGRPEVLQQGIILRGS